MRKHLYFVALALTFSLSGCGLLTEDWVEDKPAGLSEDEWTDEETFQGGARDDEEAEEILEDDDGLF
ncbi:hypothetical protein [Caenispirillum salinarum]|uniref:hypothetical protein n=1 Tax=Caenispirillum salinarum TaxID=859058 RepID=UPI00384C5A83